MKAGFWVAPEGEDAAMTVMPIGGDLDAGLRKANFLATITAAKMIERCGQAAALLPEIADALERQTTDGAGIAFDITDYSADDRALLGEVLGEGEVSGIAAMDEGVIAQIQESVMAGLWRVRFTDRDGALIADYIEVSAIPAAVRQASSLAAAGLTHGPAPRGAMNVMPILAEIADRLRAYQPGVDPHVINFSLLPMTQEDMAFLQETLGPGPVQLISRGYGSCRIISTGIRNVWSVQYFNSMDTVILDTLEICGVPEAACAAEVDFGDSAIRLREIEEAYFK